MLQQEVGPRWLLKAGFLGPSLQLWGLALSPAAMWSLRLRGSLGRVSQAGVRVRGPQAVWYILGSMILRQKVRRRSCGQRPARLSQGRLSRRRDVSSLASMTVIVAMLAMRARRLVSEPCGRGSAWSLDSMTQTVRAQRMQYLHGVVEREGLLLERCDRQSVCLLGSMIPTATGHLMEWG